MISSGESGLCLPAVESSDLCPRPPLPRPLPSASLCCAAHLLGLPRGLRFWGAGTEVPGPVGPWFPFGLLPAGLVSSPWTKTADRSGLTRLCHQAGKGLQRTTQASAPRTVADSQERNSPGGQREEKPGAG